MPRPSYAALQNQILQLQQNLSDLSTDPSYKITTRAAVDIEMRKVADHARYVVFLDVDNMHQANQEYGYETVNGMIRRACRIREADALLRARWFSGDELVFVLSADPEGFCARIKTAFKNEGLGVTMAYTKFSGNLPSDVNICAQTVNLAKRREDRGTTLKGE